MTNFGIVAGHGGTPTDIDLLSPPLFWRYALGVRDEWFQVRELAGDKKYKLIGKPRVRWTLAAVTWDEWDYLKANLFTAQSALFTIRTKNYAAAGAPFASFNCTGHWVDLSGGVESLLLPGGEALRVVLEFVDLVAI